MQYLHDPYCLDSKAQTTWYISLCFLTASCVRRSTSTFAIMRTVAMSWLLAMRMAAQRCCEPTRTTMQTMPSITIRFTATNIRLLTLNGATMTPCY